MAGVGMQAVTPRGLPHRHGIEPRRLDEHIFRLGRNHRVPAAHHSGQAQSLVVIGDDQIVGVEHALHAIQRLQPFALARPAHNDAALELVEIEGVRGLAHRQPCKVCGIDGVGDFLLLQKREVCGRLQRPRTSRAIRRW